MDFIALTGLTWSCLFPEQEMWTWRKFKCCNIYHPKQKPEGYNEF